jgi:hypothetical protein
MKVPHKMMSAGHFMAIADVLGQAAVHLYSRLGHSLATSIREYRARRQQVLAQEQAARERPFIEAVGQLVAAYHTRAVLVQLAKRLNGGEKPPLSVFQHEYWLKTLRFGVKAARIAPPGEPDFIIQLVRAQKDGKDPGEILKRLDAALVDAVTAEFPIDMAEIDALVAKGLSAHYKAMTAERAQASLAWEGKLDKNIGHLERDLAHHMAQAIAFRRALEEVDPEHPLVTNSALRERLGAVAFTQFKASRDWQVVRDVGSSFVSRKEAARSNVQDLTRDVVHHLAQSAALRHQLELVDPNNPMHSATMREGVAKAAYDAFIHDRSFDTVREVGKSFLSQDEVQRMRAISATGAGADAGIGGTQLH